MKKLSLSILLVSMVGMAFAQDVKPLTIGDPAPAFKVDGFIKGEKVGELKKGKAYIIEFWATWCGPCIAVFPHLSDLTAKYEGQITTVSVNTWDYPRGQNEDKETHVKRVSEFVEKQGEKMAYNIVLDDANDTIAKTWMTAAGRNGIPCAFIVNEEGIIAWIGHPATMDKPLEQIVNKTWDVAAFKVKFEEDAAKAKAAAKKAAEDQAKVAELAKNNDLEGFDALAKEMGLQSALITAINGDGNFGTLVLEKYAGKVEGFTPDTYCNIAAYIAGKKETSAASKETLAKVSEACFKKLDEDKSAGAAADHARILLAKGDKKGAEEWVAKADILLAKFMPESGRSRVKSMIEAVKKQIEAAND
ncbi:MAG: TlpA family protein disulfide reductase [Fimbriimonadaceae bacterium]|nr:MAG: TlpA family protein disulfide reductase [Fimbriimonadaceae bacterium]